MHLKGLLFDKDGTLFDFGATWNVWTLGIIDHYAKDEAHRQRIANAIKFDLNECAFQPDSPVIAGTNRQAAELVASAVPDEDVNSIERHLAVSAAQAPTIAPVPLEPYLKNLRQIGLKLGVMTNDTELGATSHLDQAGVLHLFDFVAGADSGFGAKPSPDPLLAFAHKVDIDPAYVAMVGDSTHDLLAGQRAGMKTIGVLTGMAKAAELRPFADLVLNHIGEIPEHLAFECA